MDALIAAPLAKFALGYLAVLAVPGPNTLAIGAMAALRGFRDAVPFCLGIAAGVGAVAGAVTLAFGLLSDAPAMATAGRLIGAATLAVLAVRIAVTVPAADAEATRCAGAMPSGGDLGAFGAGFATAATNPVTAAYMAAQFLGPLEGAAMGAALLVAPALALGFGLGVAGFCARVEMRSRLVRHHRAICTAAAAALVVLAAGMLRPLLRV